MSSSLNQILEARELESPRLGMVSPRAEKYMWTMLQALDSPGIGEQSVSWFGRALPQHGIGDVFDFRQRFFRNQTILDSLAMPHCGVAYGVAEKKIKTLQVGRAGDLASGVSTNMRKAKCIAESLIR